MRMSLIIDNIVLLILINSTPYRKLDRRTYTVKKTVHSKEDMRCVHSKEDRRCTDITASDRVSHTYTLSLYLSLSLSLSLSLGLVVLILFP
jgi:hypothetical protein